MFVAIGRLGRSLGMHLLLASQRLDEGRLRGLDAHLSYRICLKTLSASESRTVLGTLDAYQLAEHARCGFPAVERRRADSLSGRVRFGTAAETGASAFAHRRLPCPCGRSPRRHRPGRPCDETAGRRTRPCCERFWTGCPGTDRPHTKSGCRRWAQHRHCDTLLRDAGSSAGRPDRAHRHRRSSLRAVPDSSCGRLIRSRRQCRGRRRTSIGQVDGAAHADHGVGGHARSGAGAVLLPGLRRWNAGLGAHAATCGRCRRQGRAATRRAHRRRTASRSCARGRPVVPRARQSIRSREYRQRRAERRAASDERSVR